MNIVDGTYTEISQVFSGLQSGKVFNNDARKNNFYDNLIETDNLAANIIEALPAAMGQKHPVFECEQETIKLHIQKKIDEIIPHFINAQRLARLCGGSGIFIGNSESTEVPLYSIKSYFYNVFQGGKFGVLKIKEIEKNPLSPGYGKPSIYELSGSQNNSKAIIHGTKILPFYGIKCISDQSKRINKYWGLPVLNRSIVDLNNLRKANESIVKTINIFSRLVYEMVDLQTHLSTEPGRALLKKRIELVNHSWEILETLIINSGEKVYNLKTDYQGIPEILSHYKEMLAASCDIPKNLLFNIGGSSNSLSGDSSGSGSGDRSTERQWANYVRMRLNEDWLPNLNHMIGLWLSSIGKSDISWELTFPSILETTEVESVGIDKTKAETDKLVAETEVIKNGKAVEIPGKVV
jgi:phage-related protein (TIGR01555 family)